MKETLEKDKRYLLPCVCGCGVLEFIREKDKDDDILYLSYFPAGFYVHQRSFRKRIKSIWNLIRGKEYRLYDIVVDYNKFKDFAKELEIEDEKT